MGTILVQHHGSHVTGISPYEAVYGQKPPSLLTYVPGTIKVQGVEDELRNRGSILKLLKGNLVHVQ